MSLLLALLLQPVAAAEPAWQSLGVHRGIETAFDPASVRPEAGKVRVRIRGSVPNATGDGIRVVIGTLEIDCAAGTAIVLDVKGYDAAGRLMLNAINPVAERRAELILPQSPNAAVRAHVCRRPAQ